MFVSRDSINPKKKFQKPNILRRKNKVSVKQNSVEWESLNSKSYIAATCLKSERIVTDANTEKKSLNSKLLCSTKNNGIQIDTLVEKIVNVSSMDEIIQESEQNNYYQQPEIVNSYLNETIKQDESLEKAMTSKTIDNQDSTTWLEFINDTQNQVIIEPCDTESVYMEQTLDITSSMLPLSNVTILDNTVENEVQPDANDQISNIIFKGINIDSAKLKCDINDCNKEFSSEQKLKKHRNLHNKDGTVRQPRQSTIECPVKKTNPDGLEEACGRVFSIREDLVKHLNEEHTLDEAVFKCEECGRRFFWASGLRAHVRSHAARRRSVLVCPWPGCDRVFRQPCRLREHSRAHTGDKPYPCHYPNCGWSFRTASKLLRHARRHTGERRHACAVCGRAFLRREHLRDHTARHHAPHTRRTHVCTAPDCQQSFTNMSSLYMHMKKVHKKEEPPKPTPAVEETSQMSAADTEMNIFTVSLLDNGDVSLEECGEVVCEGAVDGGAGSEGQAARTHCTWPLARRHASPHHRPHDAYVLEEDVHVEQSDGAESNIYTIRSDLFLHGNIIHNEDSEHMARPRGSDGEVLASLDADLMLDAPSVDLTQEELYTDAVDESSFRVFLLSGEELA